VLQCGRSIIVSPDELPYILSKRVVYNTRYNTAALCSILQHTVSHCITLQQIKKRVVPLLYLLMIYPTFCPKMSFATHSSTLQHSVAHYNTLHHTALHCNTLQHTALHCITLQHAKRRVVPLLCHLTIYPPLCQQSVVRNTLQHTSTQLRTATHSNTQQHTAIRCNTQKSKSFNYCIT